jgi:hypothetical protein
MEIPCGAKGPLRGEGGPFARVVTVVFNRSLRELLTQPEMFGLSDLQPDCEPRSTLLKIVSEAMGQLRQFAACYLRRLGIALPRSLL